MLAASPASFQPSKAASITGASSLMAGADASSGELFVPASSVETGSSGRSSDSGTRTAYGS